MPNYETTGQAEQGLYDKTMRVPPHLRGHAAPQAGGSTIDVVTGAFTLVDNLVSRIEKLTAALMGPRPSGVGKSINAEHEAGVLNTVDTAAQILLARVDEANSCLSAIERRLGV
jgi:hypothetical protein